MVLIAGTTETPPAGIAAANGVESVQASVHNLSTLLAVLASEGVESGYVSGWNGQQGDYVLRSNGAIAPYDEHANDTGHAFVVQPQAPGTD
ncbi:hypothetical protein [Longispora fulva]|uniref:Uncharacterized protein n=1 Tax=Longispora fulva TaxID=619741 RepID=A0A8J7KIK7_9ACTN|nr:hypothetical protein [Longispora fulva]MBG6134181.1 hypothetical protein [Longispora fulva]